MENLSLGLNLNRGSNSLNLASDDKYIYPELMEDSTLVVQFQAVNEPLKRLVEN